VVLAIGSLSLIAHLSAQPLLLAPFAPSALVILTQPKSPQATPNLLIAAYVVAAVVSVLLKDMLPAEWWAVALATGAVVLLLEAFDILHAPAVALPVLVMLGQGEFPLAAFTIGVVLLATLSLLGRGLPRWTRAANDTAAVPTGMASRQNAA
jgi:CBS-domain-containing membrane protein